MSKMTKLVRIATAVSATLATWVVVTAGCSSSTSTPLPDTKPTC